MARDEGRRRRYFRSLDILVKSELLVVAGSVKGRILHCEKTLDFAGGRDADGFQRPETLASPRVADERRQIKTEIGPDAFA